MVDSRSFHPSRRQALLGAVALGSMAVVGRPGRGVAANTKTLRLATGEADGVKGTLDPAFGNNDNDGARASLVYERLVVPDEAFAPQPQLALSWKPDASGQVWTFALRQGVKFQDGSPFTANDVVFTFKRLIDPKTASPAAAVLGQIDPDGIKALDDHTVQFRLRTPVVEFPLLIANRFTYIVRAGQTAEQLRTAGIGTGPFRVEKFVPGEEPSIFARSEHYWQPGRPLLDRVELRAIAEPSSRIAALLADQVDVVAELPSLGLQRLENNPDIKIQSVRTSAWQGLAVFSDVAPFNDARVRKALKLVVNRDQYLKALVGGRGAIAYDTPIPPWQSYGLPQEPLKQNIAEAKRLLTEAGHPNGLDLELHTSAGDVGLIQTATLFKAQAAAADIRVTIVQAPAADYWTNIWLKKPFVTTSWNGRSTDEALALEFLSSAQWNETHWRNSEFDALVARARTTLDEAQRTQLYHQAQRLIQDDGGAVILVYADTVGATRANVSGYKVHPQKFPTDFSGVSIDG
ncbi:ABC transporter substrate-binding protein [Labrys sp. La1]|uniref:ABC transporter substrate-binding protein n=1 Tax=Labrys sp. La1 TaxID=3404917 RepID=UPI003EBAF582